MRTNNTTMIAQNHSAGRVLTPAVLALAAASACSAGIINPGGGSHIWTGAVNSTWQQAGNWTTGAVPADGDSAIINGGPTNIFLSGHTSELNSLYISGGLAVSSNGHRIFVNDGEERTTVTGLDSRLFLNAAAGGAASLVTGELDIENQGRLQLSGGRALVQQQLTLSGGATVTGRGRVEVVSAAPLAFSGLNGDYIAAINGDLEISVTGGGAIATPPVLNIVGAGSSLEINAPFFLPVMDVNMEEETVLEMGQPWELTGILTNDGADGAVSSVRGAAFDVSGEVIVNNGILDIESDVNFLSGSGIEIGTNESLVISGAHNAEAGCVALVSSGGVLRIDGEQGAAPPWGGSISLAAGTLEVNEPQFGNWRMDGQLSLGSFFGERSHIAGTSSVALVGDVAVHGLGGEIDTLVYLHGGATMDITMAHTRVVVNDWFIPVVGSNIEGDGALDIMPGGTVRFVEPMSVAVDVNNAGLVETDGDSDDVGYTYINGDYTQASTGRMAVGIAGPSPLEYDVYETTGDANLEGELFVQLVGGYVPMNGETFDVLTANGSLNGTFDTLIADPRFSVSYEGSTVVLTFTGCSSDLNGDAVVNGADLAMLLAAWGMPGDADFNGDGTINGSDLAILLASWGECF